MKILLVTTWEEKCGLAEFSKNLMKSLSAFPVEFQIARVGEDANLYSDTDCDVIHLGYIPTAPMSSTWFEPSFRATKIIEHHTTLPGEHPSFPGFDRVVTHHQMPNCTYIPFGIVEVEGESKPSGGLRIGTAGFPFRHKLIQEICGATAEIEGASMLLLMPESHHVNAGAQAQECLSIVDGRIPVEIIYDWLSEEEIILKLRECDVAIFGSEGDNGGIGGAVRLGIAAKVPVIVPDAWHFSDIKDYVYSMPLEEFKTPAELAKMIRRAASERKDCWTFLLREMGWSVVAQAYYDLYRNCLEGLQE